MLTPASGSEVENFNCISLEFPGINGVQYQENLTYCVILKNVATEEIYECEPVRDSFAQTNGTIYQLSFCEFDEEGNGLPINTPGIYELEIKSGAFFYGEEDEDGLMEEPIMIERITAVYTIGGTPAAYELNPAPGSFVENFYLITLSFPNIEDVEFVGDNPSSIILTDMVPGETYTCEPDRDAHAETEGTVFILHFAREDDNDYFASITEPGNYKLEIKQGAFIFGIKNEDGVIETFRYSQAITAIYTIKETAVKSISE